MAQNVSATRKRFCEVNLKKIEDLEIEQSRFKAIVSTSKRYSRIEKEAVTVSSKERFNSVWDQANKEKRRFDQNHEKGCGLFSKRYSEFGAAAQDFMEDFSPILEIVKDLASPYGNLAFGTVSVLFMVAKNKKDLEKQLRSTISAIKDRLPGLKVYQHIYNDKRELDIRLQGQITSAYQGFIEYCMLTTRYYKKWPARRWLTAIGPKKAYQDQEDAVKKAITKIRLSCEELLHNRVFEIKNINETILLENKGLFAHPFIFNDLTKIDQTEKIKDQTKKIEEMTEHIKELQSAKQDDRVRMFQNVLGLTSFSANSQRDEFKEYCNELNLNEQLNAHYLQQMRDKNLQSFKAGSEYQAWKVSEEAQLLLLWGYNNDSIGQEAECWLSPVATSTIDELGQNSYLAYNIIRNGTTAHEVLSVVLLQLLRLKKECLQNESQYAELNSDVEKYRLTSNEDKHSNGDEEAGLGALEKILARIIGFFAPSETLYIIIDRVDRCLHVTLNHRKELLDVLVKMVGVAGCKLKLLAVINGYDWDSGKYDLNSRRGKRLIIEQPLKS